MLARQAPSEPPAAIAAGGFAWSEGATHLGIAPTESNARWLLRQAAIRQSVGSAISQGLGNLRIKSGPPILELDVLVPKSCLGEVRLQVHRRRHRFLSQTQRSEG